jgi:hypothetical protein
MADMHLCYGRAHGNAREARRLFDKQFPGRLIPDARMFISIHRNFKESGTFIPATRDRGETQDKAYSGFGK